MNIKFKNLLNPTLIGAISLGLTSFLTSANAAERKATCYLFHGDTLKVKERCSVDSGYSMGESYAGFTLKGTEFIQRSYTERDSEGNYGGDESYVLEINGKSYDAQYINRNKNFKRKSTSANYQKGDMTCYLIKPKQMNVCYSLD